MGHELNIGLIMHPETFEPETRKAYEKYITHQKGLALFKLWTEKWKQMNEISWNKETKTAQLSPLSSRRFALGSPKMSRGVKGRGVFIAIQKDEREFFSRIPWKKVAFDISANPEKSFLWFISEIGYSPDHGWPDLPPIAIGIQVDANYLSSWSAKKIDWRSIWKDEDDLVHVGRQPRGSFKVVKGALMDVWGESERTGIKTLKDIAEENLEKSNIYIDPGFAGQPPPLSKEQSEYVAPFKGEKPFLIEEQNPDIFGQFLDLPPEN